MYIYLKVTRLTFEACEIHMYTCAAKIKCEKTVIVCIEHNLIKK